MLVRGVTMNVDVRDELSEHLHQFRRSTDKGTHLNACSPFRTDTVPSFYVYYEDTMTAKAGYWGDHAADSDELSKGTFLKLLAHLRNETEDMTFEYLNNKYGTNAPADVSRLKLRPNRRLVVPESPVIVPVSEYERLHLEDAERATAYMKGRKLDEEILQKNMIGQLGEAVAIPWINARGEIITVKYRSLTDKKFWYIGGGRDIVADLYGMQHVYTNNVKRLHIVEAEIDALYLMSLGYYAVAFGNKAMNRFRAELLRKAPFDELCIVPDNDDAGMFNAHLIDSFMGTYKKIYVAEMPNIEDIGRHIKDVNDLEPFEARFVIDAAEQIKPLESKIDSNV